MAATPVGVGHTAGRVARGHRLRPHRPGGRRRRPDPGAARARTRRRRPSPGRARGLVDVHTRLGVLALVRLGGLPGRAEAHRHGSTVGIVALCFCWLIALAGLLILVALAAEPRASTPPSTADDRWSEGPGFSVAGPRRHAGRRAACSPGSTLTPRLRPPDAPLGTLAPSLAARRRRRSPLALLPAASPPRRGTPAAAADGRPRRDRHAGHRPLRAGPPDRGLAPRRAGQAQGRADLGHARQRAGAARGSCATLRDGAPIHGIDLWVVPVYNPDGLARHTRKNAHGVDLNRNYPYHWVAPRPATTSPGPKPASEPETRAMMRFLAKVRPDYVLSASTSRCTASTSTRKRPAFSRRVGPRARPADHARSTAAASATAP